MSLPTHCHYCGLPLLTVSVKHGYRASGGADLQEHLRCPKKVTSSWGAIFRGDVHDEFIVPTEKGPFAPGDPGPILMEVKWR